jgi:hypothetical protein
MKKYITFLLLVAAIGVNAQNKIKSKALGDSITIPKGSFEIKPLIVTAQGDTARSLTWSTIQMQRDTTVGFKINIILFDKYGLKLSDFGLNAPPLTNTAAYLNGIDNFVMYLTPRISKP